MRLRLCMMTTRYMSIKTIHLKIIIIHSFKPCFYIMKFFYGSS